MIVKVMEVNVYTQTAHSTKVRTKFRPQLMLEETSTNTEVMMKMVMFALFFSIYECSNPYTDYLLSAKDNKLVHLF